MESIAAIKEIDTLLDFMVNCDFIKPHASDGEILNELKRQGIEVPNLIKCLNQLELDKLVNVEIMHGVKRYSISWDGEIFYAYGGYSYEIEIAEQSRTSNIRMEELQRKMTLLTIILAASSLIAAIYYLREILCK